VEVFRGSADDVGVTPFTLTDGSGHNAVIIQRAVSIFEFEFYLLRSKGPPAKLTMPMKAEFLALIDGRLILSLHEDWKHSGAPTLPQGSLVSLELSAVAADLKHLRPALVYAPTAREAFVEAGATHGHLLVHTLDNVNGRLYAYKPEPNNHWSRRRHGFAQRAGVRADHRISDAP
jgi:prolyl oligopeptidase